jgi:N4-gp56 family major capsid protein
MIMNPYDSRIGINLQLFATQTTLLNTTGNDLSPEMKTYYQDRLIDYAEPNLVHDQFGDKYPIPAHGGKTTEFRKYSPLAKALTPITEGVTPAGNKLNVSTITATVNQYGDYIEISDVLELTAIDRNIEQATKLLGSQAGRTLDTITREVITAGTNVMYAPKSDGTEVLTRATVDSTCLLTVDLIFRAVAKLRSMNAVPIDDSFVAIIHPNVACDLMRSADWIDVHKYAQPDNIYKGEIGQLGGVRFIQTTEAKIVGGAGAAVSATDTDKIAVYCTMIIAANAYGVTEVTGGGLQHIVKQLGSSGTADPLNQRATTGWKAIKTAERLVEEYMVRIEHACKTDLKAASN